MSLVLPGAPVDDFNIQAKFDVIQLRWVDPPAVRLIGGTGNPAFAGAWVNFGAGFTSAGFYRDRNRTYLQGTIKTGVIGTTAFTLPSGYWPAQICNFSVASGAGVGVVQINTAGLVTPAIGVNTDVSLDTISFVAV